MAEQPEPTVFKVKLSPELAEYFHLLGKQMQDLGARLDALGARLPPACEPAFDTPNYGGRSAPCAHPAWNVQEDGMGLCHSCGQIFRPYAARPKPRVFCDWCGAEKPGSELASLPGEVKALIEEARMGFEQPDDRVCRRCVQALGQGIVSAAMARKKLGAKGYHFRGEPAP